LIYQNPHIRFPPDYPSIPLDSHHFKLEVTTGNLHYSCISDLEQSLVEEAQNCVGQPMVFMLVGKKTNRNLMIISKLEKMKEKLELYNYDVAEGSFIMFSDEIIINIMNYFDAPSLARLARVNKKFKRLSEDDNVRNR
jgi:hypothetical protein